MTQQDRFTFQLSLSQAQLQAPETPQYLEIALRLLEMRLGELRGTVPEAVAASEPVRPRDVDITHVPESAAPAAVAAPPETVAPPPQPAARTSVAPAAAVRTPPARRARWFHDQLPRITLPDGAQVTPRSLDELKALLRDRGLTPHPRGDASMLLWQVRNRLGGTVETVPV